MRDSKITFRVSDDLLERVDEIEESRSEIMREALRSYLEEPDPGTEARESGRKTERRTHATLDDVLRGMVREVVDEAVEQRLREREPDNVNVTVNVPEGRSESTKTQQEAHTTEAERPEASLRPAHEEPEDERKTCPQCGEDVADEHVHCPNCGAKTAQRLFCDCGDEIRSDWSFCPSCGRRTPTSHALGNE